METTEHANRSHHTEIKTWIVIAITAATMIMEIVAGYITGSMALLADGWHMGTHAAALGITAVAYISSRKNLNNPQYTFGTGKIRILGAYTSAVGLLLAALFMMIEAVERLISPVSIHYSQAIIIAVIGLAVNFICAMILKGDHHHDHNIRAAFLHVVADALTSVFAIIALIAGRYLGWNFLDALMGIVGGILIMRWGLGLMRQSGAILLDKNTEPELTERIREIIEKEHTSIKDLHLWSLSEKSLFAIISLQDDQGRSPNYFKNLLSDILSLDHVIVEVSRKSSYTNQIGKTEY